MNIKLEVGGARAIQEAFARAPQIAQQEMLKAMTEAEGLLEREVQELTPTAHGTLRGSITHYTQAVPNGVIGMVGTTRNYAISVELGTQPHVPPIEPLIDWVRQKLPHGQSVSIKTRRVYRSKASQDEATRIAHAIQWKIARYGTPAAGMFHLFTHAFFKALLFLGAGSVMHAMGGVIDLERIGGLRRRLPWTYVTFLVGCLALAGVFPLSGFFSKDEILATLYKSEVGGVYRLLFYAGLAGALLTAFYTFRAFFRTFHGEELVPVEAGRHAHESPPIMLAPLVILAVASLAVGGLFGPTGWFEEFLSKTPGLAPAAEHAAHAVQETGHDAHTLVAVLSTLAALAGIAGAAILYLGPPGPLRAAAGAARALGLYALSYRKVFFDELYALTIVRPLRGLATAAAWVDRYIIDCLADLVGLVPKAVGALLRDVQTGLIPWYASAMMLGMLALLAALILI